MLEWTSESVTHEEDVSRSALGDSNPRHEESKPGEEDKAEVIEKSQPPQRRSKRARGTPVLFSDTMMVPAKDPETYKQAVRGDEENK